MAKGLLPHHLPLYLVRIGRRFPWIVLVLALAAWAAAGLLASQVAVDTDLLSLVPRDNKVVQDFKSTIERFGSLDTLLAVVRLEEDTDMDSVLAFSDVLAGTLREWELVDWVEYRLENPAVTASPLLDRATLFLTGEEVEELLAQLDEDGLREQALVLRSQLMTPQSVVTKELLRLDPMGMLPKILDRVRLGGVGLRVDPETGCLVDGGRSMLLMLVKPVKPAQDIAFDHELVAGLEEKLEEVKQSWRDEGWEGEPPQVEFTGGYVIALDDSKLIISDAVVGMSSSLVGVMLLFLLAFGRRSALVYAFVPLVTGLALTFIFIMVALGRLNSLTSAFGGLLVGLGIDFIIVLYGRYVEERKGGANHDDAVDAMGRYTGAGVLLGAVTTAGTFYAFLITDFRGLWELGLLTGTGILLLVATVFTVLPALLSLLQDRTTRARPHYLHSFGSDMVCRASLKRPGFTILVTLVVTVALGAAISRLVFDDDIRNMRSADNRGILLQQEVMDAFGLRFTPMTVRIDGDSDAEVLAAAKDLVPELEALVDGETLGSVDTIARIVPFLDDQNDVITDLQNGEGLISGFEERFATALEEVGLNPVGFQEGFGHLRLALGVRAPLALSDLSGTALESVVNRYVVRHESGVSTAIYCYPPAGKWRRDAPPKLVELVSRHEGVVLAGPNVVSAELRRVVWGDAGRAAAIGMIVVFFMLWADLGSPLRSLFVLIPLLVGMVWMLGAMAVLGLQMNIMNIFVLTMIIGIGVDYGIHLLHRWYESGGDAAALSETAKAIAVAALTTMVGFGSLVLSHYPGLRSVGAVAILGALSTAVLSITLLPVLLSRVGRIDGEKTER